MPNSVRNSVRAAYQPHMPCTPAPGGVAAEHRYTLGIGVRQGFNRGVGPAIARQVELAPTVMSREGHCAAG